MNKEELLTKKFEFETTVEISIYNLLWQFNDAEKRVLVQELIDEISTEDNQDLIINQSSLEDEFKRRHFTQVQNDYSLEEIETLLPNKEK